MRKVTRLLNAMKLRLKQWYLRWIIASEQWKRQRSNVCKTWGRVAEIENKFAEADLVVNRLRNWRNEFKVKCERKAPEKEVKFEQELHQTRMKFQSELQAAKAAQKESSSDSKDGEATTKTYAKLPKLEITKFNGTYQDWIRFWGQFEETIDKTGVPNVTKFSNLRELLNAQVHRKV